MALTASSASMPSDARKAKRRKLFAFRVRTAAPASLRSSTEENCLSFPPPTSSSRLAFILAGLCKSVVSKFLPVTSPLAITSAAASCTALSFVATKASVLSFSPRSRTTATRHSVSTSAGVEKERFVFMLCRTVSLGDVQMRKRSAEHESPALGVLHARLAWRLPRHTVSSPPQIFSTRFLTSSFPSANSALVCSVRLLSPKAVPGGRYDTAKWIKQSGKKVSAAFFRSALAVLEHRTFASAVRRLGDGYGFRRCRELFAEEQRTGCDRADCSGCADGNAGPSNGSNRADPDSSEKGEEASANDRHLRE